MSDDLPLGEAILLLRQIEGKTILTRAGKWRTTIGEVIDKLEAELARLRGLVMELEHRLEREEELHQIADAKRMEAVSELRALREAVKVEIFWTSGVAWEQHGDCSSRILRLFYPWHDKFDITEYYYCLDCDKVGIHRKREEEVPRSGAGVKETQKHIRLVPEPVVGSTSAEATASVTPPGPQNGGGEPP